MSRIKHRLVKNSRYASQKARLNESGIKDKFYLVEDAEISAAMAATSEPSRALDRNTLEQAISNTCIRDG